MNSAASIAIQIGLIIGPVIAFLVLKVKTSSRVVHCLGAAGIAVLTGWSAFYFRTVHAWLPRLKHGGEVDLSPLAVFWVFFAAMLILLLLVALHKPVEAREKPNSRPVHRAGDSRDWRVGHTGRDRMYYEEFRGGTWQQITIDGEMLMGPAHHVIYFATPEKWDSYPEWARGRRVEIIARIKSEFAPPDYEYFGG